MREAKLSEKSSSEQIALIPFLQFAMHQEKKFWKWRALLVSFLVAETLILRCIEVRVVFLWVNFKVLTKDGQKIGKVSKQWSGLVKEGLTDADNFGVSFPMDLDVRVKLSLMAVVFLIVSAFQRQFSGKLFFRISCSLKIMSQMKMGAARSKTACLTDLYRINGQFRMFFRENFLGKSRWFILLLSKIFTHSFKP